MLIFVNICVNICVKVSQRYSNSVRPSLRWANAETESMLTLLALTGALCVIYYLPLQLKYRSRFFHSIPRKIPTGGNNKVYGIFPIFAGNLPHIYFLPPRHLPFNYEKVKVYHGKVNNCDNWRPKVNDKFDSV